MDNRNLVIKLIQTSERFPERVFSDKGLIYTCINPFSYHLVRKFNGLYDTFDGLFVDGLLMCWMIYLLWGKKIQRLSFDMTGIAKDLFELLNKNKSESIYFIGAKQEAIGSSISQIKSAYKQINIVGFRNGYFLLPEYRQAEIEKIVSINPTYVIVGMGAPIQERFAIDLKNAGYKGIIFTCGGFLHQSSNNINYYPNWINKYNLRAFYRLFHEKGLWGRLYNVLIEFPILFTWDTLITKYSRNNRKHPPPF